MKRLLVLAAALLAVSIGGALAQLSYVRPSDLASVVPAGAGSTSGLVYASNAPVVINSSTTTSVFPPGSAAARTLPANTLTVGRSFRLDGGGIFTTPTANTLSADIVLKVGSATIVSVTTPAVLVATNQGVDFHAVCVVVTSTTITCTGTFMFTVLNNSPSVVPFNSVTAKTFDPTVADLIDVLGDWNGTTTTQATTVQTASLIMLN